MTRFTLSVAALVVAGAAMGQSLVRAGPWPMKYANAARTSQSLYPGADLGVVAATFRARGKPPGMAVDSGGRIYVGATFYSQI